VLALLIYAVLLPINEGVGIALSIALAGLFYLALFMKAPLILVTAHNFRVGKATIDRRYLGRAEVISAEASFSERGHKLNALAFTSLQSSVRTMLKVEITDKDDQTPYWLFSTRNPEELKSLLG
jgi:hypothetical protein